jgi:streptomycin 6-kinase
VIVPEALRRNVERHPAGPAWLAGLPDRCASLAERWDLVVGAPFTNGVAAWTAPARRRDGTDVVLKLSLPHEEARGEPAALRHWSGHGAVRLLGSSPDDWALLLERCLPGSGLGESPAADDERLRTGAGVLRRLHEAGRPAAGPPDPGIASMSEVCLRGADTLAETAALVGGGRSPLPVDDGLVDTAAALLRDLPRTAGRDVVVHGDLNPGNLLRADAGASPPRGGTTPRDVLGDAWLAIDPKPLRGDPAYDPWPLVSQVGQPFDAADTGDAASVLRRRTGLVAREAGLDVGRVRAWCLARCLQSAFWYAAERRWSPAAAELAGALVWARVAT